MAEPAPPERVYPSPPERGYPSPPEREYPSPPPPSDTPASVPSPPPAWPGVPGVPAAPVVGPPVVRLRHYRSAHGLAMWAIAAYTISATLQVVTGGTPLLVLLLAYVVEGGQPFAMSPALGAVLAAAGLLSLLSVASVWVVLPALVAVWAGRCGANAATMAPAPARWSTGWAVCGWFVPIANLFVPFLVVRELWAAERPGRGASALLAVWWAFWLVQQGFVWFTLLPLSWSNQPLAVAAESAVLVVLGPATSALGIFVVHRLTLLQDARQRWFVGSGAAAAVTAPEGPPRWAARYQPIEALSTLASAAAVVAATAGMTMFLLGAGSLFVLGQPLFNADQLVFSLWSFALIAFALTGLVIAPIATAVWSYRAHRNLPALGAGGLTWSPGWAAAAWFVPVANLFVPYLIARETWRGSGGERPALALWWTALVGAAALTILANELYNVSAAAGDVALLLAELALAVAALLFLRVVAAVTGLQRERAPA